MTTSAYSIPDASPVRPPGDTYLDAQSGVWSWLATKDHKRIGVMFFFATTLSLILGGVFALLIRLELLTPGPTFFDAYSYNRMFTMHGVVMVWLFMIPSIPTVFGNFMLPLMIGARDVAFPRLNLASFYIYVAGASLVLWGLFNGGVDTGWTFYAPYSTSSPGELIPVAGGIVIMGFSSIITGINFIVTIHTLRARGLGWMKLPLFAWSIYATSIIQVLATPVLAMVLTLVGLDRIAHLGLFDPAQGGDPLLFQHLFWFYSHPAVYIMILPAQGVMSELVCHFSRQQPLSYRAIAFSSLGIAFGGFLAWGHHMFVAGLSDYGGAVFALLSMFVAVFSAIKVFTWTFTLYRGSIAITTPFIYFLAFLFLFVFGGMTGVAVAAMSLDVPWHDTYFVVAHFHFIMVGGTLTAFLGAIHYWFPKMTGRMYNETWGFIASGLVFGGFFFTFFPQFLLGNAGMPRRYYNYSPDFQLLHVASSAGASLLALGLVITLVYLTVAAFKGPRAGKNPWGVSGLEWRTTSPPPEHNFHMARVELDPSFEPYGYTREEQ